LHIIKRFYQSLSLSQAIEYAASAVDPEGKINPHQRRIGKKRLRQSAGFLNYYASEIKRAKSFADLFAVTEVLEKFCLLPLMTKSESESLSPTLN